MRRLATALSLSAAALLLVSTPALAAPAHKAAHPVAHPKPAPKAHRVVELTGVVSDTATVTIAVPSDTSTVTISDTPSASITIKVKGGARSLHGTTVSLVVDRRTVVRRGVRGATVADLRAGDHVSVKAQRLDDGRWYALRINAAPRGR